MGLNPHQGLWIHDLQAHQVHKQILKLRVDSHVQNQGYQCSHKKDFIFNNLISQSHLAQTNLTQNNVIHVPWKNSEAMSHQSEILHSFKFYLLVLLQLMETLNKNFKDIFVTVK